MERTRTRIRWRKLPWHPAFGKGRESPAFIMKNPALPHSPGTDNDPISFLSRAKGSVCDTPPSRRAIQTAFRLTGMEGETSIQCSSINLRRGENHDEQRWENPLYFWKGLQKKGEGVVQVSTAGQFCPPSPGALLITGRAKHPHRNIRKFLVPSLTGSRTGFIRRQR